MDEFKALISRNAFGRPGPLLQVKCKINDLIEFPKEVPPQLDEGDSTYMFTDTGSSVDDRRVSISFVAPTSSKSLILRLKYSSPLVVTLGPSRVKHNST